MPSWKLNSLQIVWFINQASADLRAESIYHSLVGSYPQNTQRNQIPGAPPEVVTSIAAGQDTARSHQLQIQPGRIDFIVSAATPPSAPRTPPLLNDPKVVIDDVLARVAKVDLLTVTVSRVAVVGNFWSLTKTPDQAAQEAIGRVGLDQDWTGASDFVFQINKPVKFNESVSFNRVISWNTSTVQLIQYSPGGGLPAMSPASQLSESYAATLNVDVNTIPVLSQIFSKDDLDRIFEGLKNELVRLWKDNSLAALLIT